MVKKDVTAISLPPVTDEDARFYWREYVECSVDCLTENAIILRRNLLEAVRKVIAENQSKS